MRLAVAFPVASDSTLAPDSDAFHLLSMIRIEVQPDPRWTEEFVVHMEKYGDAAYGHPVTKAMAASERTCIAARTPHQRHPMLSYEILADDELAGEIAVEKERGVDGRFELTIAVLDKHSGRGIAKEAMRLFLLLNTNWPLSALVKVKNPHHAKVAAVLLGAGFQERPNHPDTLYVKDR